MKKQITEIAGKFTAKVKAAPAKTKAELKKLVDKAKGRLEALQNKSNLQQQLLNKRYQHNTDVLIRKSRGITRANKEAAQLRKDLDELRAQIDRPGVEDGSETFKGLAAKFVTLDSKVDSLWQDQQDQLDKLRDDLNVLTKRVDGHEERLNGHDERHAGHDRRLDEHSRDIEGLQAGFAGMYDHVNGTTTQSESHTSRWGVAIAFGVAVLIGALTATIWWRLGIAGQLDSWIVQLSLPVSNEAARGPIGITLAGLAGFFATLFIAGWIVPSITTRVTHREELTHSPSISRPRTSAESGQSIEAAATAGSSK